MLFHPVSSEPDFRPGGLRHSWFGRVSAWMWVGLTRPGALLREPSAPLYSGPATAGYELLHWPDLHGMPRTAGLLRALSVMSSRPVSLTWFARKAGWREAAAQAFLDQLVESGDARPVGLTDRRH
jgi:hypothetical protein